MKSPGYWGVIQPDFIKKGKFTIDKRDEAIDWCMENCTDKFIPSDIFPWAFLNKKDAEKFQKQFGGTIKYKEPE